MSQRANARRLWPALLSMLILCSAALTLSPTVAAKWAGAEPCVSSNGVPLKQQYGYSVAVITSDCTEVPVGQKWAASAPWVMDSRFELRPSGFTTDYATPLDDFRGNFKSIDYATGARLIKAPAACLRARLW